MALGSVAVLYSFPRSMLTDPQKIDDRVPLGIAQSAPKSKQREFAGVFDELAAIWTSVTDSQALGYAQLQLERRHVLLLRQGDADLPLGDGALVDADRGGQGGLAQPRSLPVVPD
jgi:hypothetical protein